ncbi:MAG: 30S ribosome-binding factor RbfA [Clostridia bacterium]|nr:30S ribosome-binding factor RbfA [Clostridia bacterium]
MQRHQRLEEDSRVAISEIIANHIKNPEVTGLISVTKVSVTPDQKYAKVFVSIYNVKNKHKVLNALNSSSSFVRYELGQRVHLRNVPQITFELDDSLEYGAHMDKLLNQIKETKN